MYKNLKRKRSQISQSLYKLTLTKLCSFLPNVSKMHFGNVRLGKRVNASFRHMNPTVMQPYQILTVNDVWLKLIECPAGCFIKGYNTIESGSATLEFIDYPFLLGETEVTQKFYEAVLGENPSAFQSKNRQLKFKSLYPFSDQHPVEAVSWYDAVYFCNQLSALEGLSPFYVITGDIFTEDIQQEIKYENVITSIEGLSMDFDSDGYRLPFPYEWEYAAKAGTQNLWAGTNDADNLGDYAWYKINSNGSTNPVAIKLPNEWGFYDMSGNVSEWCNELDCSTEEARVRGGNCLMSEASARIDGTDALSKGKVFLSVGFRLARSIRS